MSDDTRQTTNTSHNGLPADIEALLDRAAEPSTPVSDDPMTESRPAQSPAAEDPLSRGGDVSRSYPAGEDTDDASRQEAGASEASGEAGEPHKQAATGISWKSILGGDILTHSFFRRQMGLLALLVIYAIIYISNRYSVQQQMIEIDRLKKELTDIKYDALTRSSELTEKSRQSRIEDYVSQEESDLQISTNPPYLIE